MGLEQCRGLIQAECNFGYSDQLVSGSDLLSIYTLQSDPTFVAETSMVPLALW